MKVLGIITARGGSKGIPRKNLALLAGRPLLAYTAEAAQRSKLLARTIISTDDEEIAAAARRLNIECPFMRPAELARDDTASIPVLQDVVRKLEAAGQRYDAVFTLQPTNPLRLAGDIDGAIELLVATGVDSVIGFAEVGEHHPARMKLIDDQGRVVDPPFAEQFEGQRRQELSKLYLRDGAVYVTHRDVLMQENSLRGKDCRAWLIPQERALNIDTPFDLYLAEQLLKLNPELFPGHAAALPSASNANTDAAAHC